MDATIDLLHDNGITRVTTPEVARRAGVSRGALTHHFPSREAIITRSIESMLARVNADMARFGKDFADRNGSSDEIAVAQGIHIAIGHADATPEQIHAAAAAGASLSTHLGNGAAANLPRRPNFLWAQLADDRLSASFIADGHHLPADTLITMLRAKGLERSVLVSDLAAPGGLEPGIYDQPIGGRVQLWADDRA